MTTHPRRRLLAIGLAAAFVVAACSGGESGSSVDTTAAGPADEPIGTTIEEATSDPSAPEPAAADDEPVPDAAPAEQAPAEAEPVASDLPDTAVIDVNSGGEFVLSDLVPSDRPILLWMWAPH